MTSKGAEGETPDRPTPAPLFEAARGHHVARHLVAASETGVFEALAEGPLTLDALGEATGLGSYRARILADANVASGFLAKDDEGRYRNGETAQAFLAGTGPADMRPLLRFWDRITLPAWGHFTEAMRTGEAPGMGSDDPEDRRIFSEGVEALTAPTARALAGAVDWSGTDRLLDVGGGTGSFLRAILSNDESMEGTLFELPPVAKIAQGKLKDMGERVEVVAGDLFEDPLPEGHDAVLLANTVHLWQPGKNREVLNRVRKAVEPGARLLLADFWTNADKTEPALAAYTAGDFFLVNGEGDVYSVEEVRAWLDEAGFGFVDHRPLAGPQSLVVAEAV